MPNVAKPNPEPTLPAECDIFTPPIDTSIPSESAPAFAEWTRTGAPDDSLVMTGSNYSSYSGDHAGKDTRFLVYGQTDVSDGILTDTAVHRLDGLKAAVRLDAALPAWSMYLIWPQNSAGYGYPVAVNRTDAWWVGPKKTVAGATISVFGQNLAHENGTTTSYVYVKPASGEGQWATVFQSSAMSISEPPSESLRTGVGELFDTRTAPSSPNRTALQKLNPASMANIILPRIIPKPIKS
jgi:hypothetical protein